MTLLFASLALALATVALAWHGCLDAATCTLALAVAMFAYEGED